MCVDRFQILLFAVITNHLVKFIAFLWARDFSDILKLILAKIAFFRLRMENHRLRFYLSVRFKKIFVLMCHHMALVFYENMNIWKKNQSSSIVAKSKYLVEQICESKIELIDWKLKKKRKAWWGVLYILNFPSLVVLWNFSLFDMTFLDMTILAILI